MTNLETNTEIIKNKTSKTNETSETYNKIDTSSIKNEEYLDIIDNKKLTSALLNQLNNDTNIIKNTESLEKTAWLQDIINKLFWIVWDETLKNSLWEEKYNEYNELIWKDTNEDKKLIKSLFSELNPDNKKILLESYNSQLASNDKYQVFRKSFKWEWQLKKILEKITDLFT